MNCSRMRSRMILFAYFRLNSPPRAKPITPTISTPSTARQANAARKKRGAEDMGVPSIEYSGSSGFCAICNRTNSPHAREIVERRVGEKPPQCCSDPCRQRHPVADPGPPRLERAYEHRRHCTRRQFEPVASLPVKAGNHAGFVFLPPRGGLPVDMAFEMRDRLPPQ